MELICGNPIDIFKKFNKTLRNESLEHMTLIWKIVSSTNGVEWQK
jgi:hypothetical protein